RLEFAGPDDLSGDEWAIDCAGFTLWVDAASVRWLDGAFIDYEQKPAGGQLQIRAPKIKGEEPDASASLVERVRWVIEHEINPQLAMHRGNVVLQEVTGEGVVVLRFGGGCHGCGMVDVTLRNGIEKTLLARVPGVTAVRAATDHDTGQAPYVPRGGAERTDGDGRPPRMFTSAELSEALRRRQRGSLRPQHPPGEFPPGWRAWFAMLRERMGTISGATADAIVALMLQRELRQVPRRLPKLNDWQAFATLWRQQWHPASRDERGQHIAAMTVSALAQFFIAFFLLWVGYARYGGEPMQDLGDD